MMPDVIVFIMLTILIVASISIIFMRTLLSAIIVFGVYSLGMALVWQQLNAPDIAITEAAVGVILTIVMVSVASKVKGEDS